jgi:hypothetical protein
LELINRKNGIKTLTVQWELSPDGKMLTVKATSLSGDGSTRPWVSQYLRVSGSTGFAGGWRNTNPLVHVPPIWQIRLGNHRLQYAFPGRSQYADVALDGSDATVRGTGTPVGSSIAFKELSPRDLSMTKKLDGQVLSIGYLQITADGRSLTESYWSPERPNEKAVLVYEKQ